MNVIGESIRQPVTVIVGMILVVLAGVLAITRIPVQLTPTVDSTIVTVATTWEGASPQEIEQNVIDKQEERLLGTTNLRLLTSSSEQGQGRIRMEFHTGTDKAESLREVSDRLREVPDYPENVDEPVVRADDWENRDFITWIVLETTDPSFDVRTLQDFTEDRIKPSLERLDGVSEIGVLGGWQRELQVRVDLVRLAQHGITPSRFVQVIRDTNQNVSAGQVETGKLDVRLRTVGQYRSTAEIEDTVIADSDAGTVHVHDVATVVQTFKEPTNFVRSRGQPVIAINAEREVGSNVMHVMDAIKAEVARLNAPGGLLDSEGRRLGINGTLRLNQVYDQTIYIEDALDLVIGNIWVGGALATLVLLGFLRSMRSVSIIAVAIPISVLGGVVVMVAMGRTVNVVSLAGMAFAVGMVVDNAIVVLENTFRHLEMGKPRMKAALDGAREVWGAVLASTLTTLVAFIPILLVREEAGQLFRDISLAICASIALSLVVSVTLIPCAAARLLRERDSKKARAGADESAGGIPGAVGRLIYLMSGSTAVRLGTVAALTVVSVAGTWLMMPPADYLPQGNRNLVFGLIVPPPGYNIEQVNTMADRIEETVRPYWEAGGRADPKAAKLAESQLPAVPTFDWSTMSPGEPVVPPPLENYFLVSFDNILFHGGISADPKRVADVKALFGHATRTEVLPGVFAFAFQVPLFQLGGATGSAIKLQLAGPDLDQVVKSSVGVMGRLFAEQALFGQVLPEPGNFAIPTPELQVRPDLVRLSELGLTTRDVGLAVQAAGDGAIIDEYRIGGESIDLKVVAMDAAGRRRDVHIEDVAIATPGGAVVTLGSIAEILPVGAPQAIARVGRQRAVSFQVTPAEGVPLEQAMQRLEEVISESRQAGQIPPTIITTMAGSASKLQAVRAVLLGDGTFLGTISSSMVLALFVVYLVMCVLFQSFMKPLVIMLTVPLATLGGFMALAAVRVWSLADRYMPDQSMDVLTMLGFVLLIGVVVNNAILIVHQSGNFMTFGSEFGGDGAEPMPPRRAIAEAVRTRIRPIFMTTLTSVLGMAPLVLMPGSGSELYRGLGSVVCGGLLVSTIFTIFLTPLLLSLVTDLQQRRRARDDRREAPPRRHPPTSPRPAAGVPASAARSSDA